MSDNTFYAILAGIICGSILTILLMLSSEATYKAAIAAGYVQRALPGLQGAYWTKP